MRKSNLIGLFLSCTLGMPTAYAFTWNDLWWRADQQGEKAMNAGDPKKAAQLFQSPNWQGVAHYRAGNYKQAMENFSTNNTPDNLYNKGNALAQMGDYPQAIDAYQQALAQNPQMQDAQYNKELLEKLMKQKPQNQASSQNQQQNKNNQDKQSEQNQQAQNQQNNNQDNSQQDKQNQQNKLSQTQQEQQSQQNQAQNSPQQPSSPDQQNQFSAADKTADAQDAQAKPAQQNDKGEKAQAVNEQQQATEQWLSGIPDDPGGLLRQKFQRDHENYQDLQSQGQEPW